jgi:hypothetical protein
MQFSSFYAYQSLYKYFIEYYIFIKKEAETKT